MTLGIRGRLFALSLGAILLAAVLASMRVSVEVRDALESRATRDLEAIAALAARQVASAPAGSDWQAVAEDVGRTALARTTLIAEDGSVLGDSEVPRADVPKMENQGRRPEVERALDGARSGKTAAVTTAQHQLFYVAVPIASSRVRVVRVAQSLAYVQAAVVRAQFFVWMGALGAIAVAAFLASAGATFVSKAIGELRSSARAMLDDLSVRTRLRQGDEIGALGEALDQLADHLSHNVEKLGSERDRLAGILETMEEGVLLTDATGRIAIANESLRMMVASSGQLIGKEPIEAIRNNELAEMIESVERTEKAVTGEVELIGIVPRQVLVRAAPLAVRGNQGVVAVLSDVTELRRLETLRRDFVANVSHELRTPIAAIRAAAETLEGGAIDDPQAGRDFLGMIVRHGERLHQLVEDLLELSRIEAQKLDLQAIAVDGRELIGHMIGLYALQASRKEVGLVFGVCPPNLALSTDRRALEQILSNLIDNAIKYASRGAKVTLSAAEKDGEVTLAVADTGPGIAAKHLPRLFERFYRVDRGRSRDVGGTGLGLSIVKHLTEALGGHVTVESIPGVGSKFSIHLPMKLARKLPALPEETRSSPDAGLSHQP